jgi:uncharacterized protein (TIGR03435 family)
VDATGLKGVYVFRLDWEVDEDVLTVMQEDFGLRIESGIAPMEIAIVDHIEKPAEN